MAGKERSLVARRCQCPSHRRAKATVHIAGGRQPAGATLAVGAPDGSDPERSHWNESDVRLCPPPALWTGRLRRWRYTTMQPWQVSDVMTTEVIATPEKTPVTRLVDIMSTHRISAVPIVADDNRVVGVVSQR